MRRPRHLTLLAGYLHDVTDTVRDVIQLRDWDERSSAPIPKSTIELGDDAA